jgi:hypothetical protein
MLSFDKILLSFGAVSFGCVASIDYLILFIILSSSAKAQAQPEAELAIILKYPASARPSGHPS